jgi:TRAP transporter TAXI family solute receptor
MKYRIIKTLKAMTLALTAFTCTVQAENVSIATGGTGGVYYPMGGGLAAVLSKYLPNMQATAEVTGGTVDNINLVGSGKPYIGFGMTDAAQDAFSGQGKFVNKKQNIRALLVLYPNRMHLVSVESTGIKTMADLKGKHVSTGSPGSATEVMAFRLLEAAGLDKDKDIKRERLGAAESVNAIKDRKIDAFFWVGGLPTAAVTDLANSPGMKIAMIDHDDTVAKMNQKYGSIYFKDVIPKTMYSGMAKDNQIASVANILFVNSTMSDKDAYNIVKTVFDKLPELINVHAEYKNIKLEAQKSNSAVVPFHPGALQYFKEKGVKVD